MSYFMTISGHLGPHWVPSAVELVAASQAQPYIAQLARQLEEIDGGPVSLVHDRQTGTSDSLVSELVSSLLEGRAVAGLPLLRVLEGCIAGAANFRVWYANNDPLAYKHGTTQVSDLESALSALANHRGVWWHA